MKATPDEFMEKFFGGLRINKDMRFCKICGSPISEERLKEFPKTGFCKTECTLKWLDSHNVIPCDDGEENKDA